MSTWLKPPDTQPAIIGMEDVQSSDLPITEHNDCLKGRALIGDGKRSLHVEGALCRGNDLHDDHIHSKSYLFLKYGSETWLNVCRNI